MNWPLYWFLVACAVVLAIIAIVRIVRQNNRRRWDGGIVAPGDSWDSGHHPHDSGGHDGGGGHH